jgi:hypothetical protein
MAMEDGATIKSQFDKTLSSTGPPGRPSLLPEAAQNSMIEFVHVRRADDNAVTYAGPLEGLDSCCWIILSGDFLKHILRSMATAKRVVAVPKDSDRVDFDGREMDAWYHILSEKSKGGARPFVCNFDENGWSEYIEQPQGESNGPGRSSGLFGSRTR